jgi:hypothetical protein
MVFILFVITLTLGIISVRARLMGSNGGVLPATTSRRALSTLAAILTIAILAWAALSFPWYFPVAGILVANLVIIGLVQWGAWPLLRRAVPWIDPLVVVLALVLLIVPRLFG